MDKKWFLYVVQCRDRTLYTGITTNISRRLLEHNSSSKGAKYTKSRRPVKLIFSKEYPNRSAAARAEYAFKKLTRREKLNQIKET